MENKKYTDKMRIRTMINNARSDYEINGNVKSLLKIAILKGLYIATGGTKGIPIYKEFDTVVNYSAIVFKYMTKIDRNVKERFAVHFLVKNLNDVINTDKLTLDGCIFTNSEISKLLGFCISQKYINDDTINGHNVERITLDILNELREANYEKQ